NYRPATIPGYASTNGTGTEIFRRNLDWNTSGTLTYTHTFATDHHLSALGGIEYKEINQSVFSGAAQGFSSPLLTRLSSASTYTSITSTYTGNKIFSYLGSLRYDYKGKYLVNGNIRDDGSSRFGGNKKFGLFGGVSVGWRISQEDFLKDVSFLSDLKLKASYGVTGVQPTGDYTSFDQFSPGGAAGGYQGSSSLRQTALGNPDLSWEQSTQTDLGVDFAFFNNRITGSVDVYQKNNSRLILGVALPSSSGFGTIQQNVGKVEAKGIDLELSTVNLNLKGFQWTTNFNIAFTKNKLKELYNGLQYINTARNYQVGQPLNVYWYYKYAGVNPADGRPMYYDKNDKIT
ncbi:MAG: TonB-dependent receptor, partial [Sphingobacteriaceae bacterium]